MSDSKDLRRRRNAEAGAVGKLGRDRQSAMVKALQTLERAGEPGAGTQTDPVPPGTRSGDAAERSTVYPTKGYRWIDPELCAPWRWADRPDSEAPHTDELARSIERDGQVAPAIVRPVRDPDRPEIRYEIIAGCVRWRAALRARQSLLVDIRPDLSDRAAFAIMVVENDLRRGLSDYTQSKRYQRALEEGLFASKGELAAAMGLSNTQMSKYLGFAKLSEAVVAACRDIAALPLTTGYLLATLCGKGFQEQVAALLPRIEAGEIAGRQLEQLAADPKQFRRYLSRPLAAADTDTPPAGRSPPRRFVSSSGQALFTVNLSQRHAVVSFPGRLRALLDDERFLNQLQALVEQADTRSD
ncbi:MAG: ParB/RepB/Spo0J family partition protein [Candidatus Competibacter sp.]|nr:ParB/RepB/Spo0J family partition protein [Candidatus Competibacter sp.]